MKKGKKKKKRFFFLFNDILLLCKKETHKRFWLRIHITLRSPYVSVEDVENSSFNNEFRLHCRSRSFIIYAMTAEQKRVWVEELKKSIEGTHPEEKKKTDVGKKDEPKDEVRKTKKEPKVEKSSDDEVKDPDPEPKKKEHRNKSKKPSQKVAKPEENNLLPFDPFAPVSQPQQRPNTSNPFSPSPVANPFLGVGVNPQQPLQPNLITTAPLGGTFDLGFNPALGGGLQVNMGFNVGLNQPLPTNSNPFNPNPGFNPQASFNPPANYNQPAFPTGQLNVAGTNPFTSGSTGFNQLPLAMASSVRLSSCLLPFLSVLYLR